jgi:hypothetical protein
MRARLRPRAMESCSECGNSEEVRRARAAGVDARVFALRSALEALAGLRVREADAGDQQALRAPFVSWQVVDALGFVQLENLAKSLLLSASRLSSTWRIEVEFNDALTFVLRPQGKNDQTGVVAAQTDLPTLAHAIARDSRLGWWRRT